MRVKGSFQKPEVFEENNDVRNASTKNPWLRDTDKPIVTILAQNKKRVIFLRRSGIFSNRLKSRFYQTWEL
ncbi:hypothetical protein LEP1GSC103_3421 [Leptospira borgpetersenii serovar Javanica str. UI 09931]|uniref:Uncharacterized protein n=5 Tax=Leptospira borgpetersenii TaxID=174 RepID=M3GD01_LEPBO|nr:hypothetical protein [Leptospira borgpetersenii]EMF98801.1 hypothetical protein LEP1GSC123_3153 [Leptospira borgpetersenii str. 200701203]EMK11826.1 hypothetical protein LEP1GSC066_1231 [Leptospira sp. serovar Kenya str. Sh9]EMO09663.1 hypothetical protein LEP1GSC137_1412 [Leptospira borgpetersenii str. Noumea 25]ALO25539.1 hypothetical protein LBBP_01239 [Leptospira borgpetersenii serovar Ballum]EKP14044.1 hypothetical protein LEP1GSC128_0492 [Leptospira borgpetersenii str. 200801926]